MPQRCHEIVPKREAGAQRQYTTRASGGTGEKWNGAAATPQPLASDPSAERSKRTQKGEHGSGAERVQQQGSQMNRSADKAQLQAKQPKAKRQQAGNDPTKAIPQHSHLQPTAPLHKRSKIVSQTALALNLDFGTCFSCSVHAQFMSTVRSRV